MFSFLPAFHFPRFDTPFSNSNMQLFSEEPSNSRESLPVPEGRIADEAMGLWRATGDLEERQKAKIDAQRVDILRLRKRKDEYAKGYRWAKERTVELERKLREASEAHQKILEERDQHIQAMTDRLTLSEELLALRSAELTVAQSFLSTTDSLSEAEVLGIVRDLNENIFQVAANLTEEWEKLGLSQTNRFAISQHDIDTLSSIYGSILIQSSSDRDPTAVTFLVQSCLCSFVTQITSSWRHDQGLATLWSAYKKLYTSKGQAISARWRSLTHSHLPPPPPHSASIARCIGDTLWITGSFSSPRRSFDFVNAVALKGIETIDKLALRLESVFMVEVTSSDISLLSETPHVVFDKTRMTNEFGSDEVSASGRRDRVAGTTEIGVGKNVYGGHGEVLLKPKVVLERDVGDS